MTNTASSQAAPRWSLQRRVVLSLLGYLILLTAGVLANDFVVNERAEALLWESMLNTKLDYFLSRRDADADYRLPEGQNFQVLVIDRSGDATGAFASLAPGIHDEIVIDGREKVILIRDAVDARFVLALNITDLEGSEAHLRNMIFLSSAVAVVLLGLMAAWGANRLIRPFHDLSNQMRALNPEVPGQRLHLPDHSSAELEVITASMNHFIASNERFMERERDFVNTTSHELRTPLTIIDGTIRLALNDPGLTDSIRERLLRVQGTIADTNELIGLLLVLAKDPQRLNENSETIELHTLVREIVDDHRDLAAGKNLSLTLLTLAENRIVAPPQMVKSAIGNLIRNAIESTYRGEIRISLDSQATVTIEDPGHGMPIEELGKTYALLARGAGRDGGGIGLSLISRLCNHCGWTLSFAPNEADGTRVALRFQM